jgi:hypothetical protein
VLSTNGGTKSLIDGFMLGQAKGFLEGDITGLAVGLAKAWKGLGAGAVDIGTDVVV